jgi:hypothetical protein
MRPAEPPNFPESQTPFVRLSASLVQAAFLFTAKSLRPYWHAVATVYPLGNRDSLKLETRLSYLTRLGTVSYRS